MGVCWISPFSNEIETEHRYIITVPKILLLCNLIAKPLNSNHVVVACFDVVQLTFLKHTNIHTEKSVKSPVCYSYAYEVKTRYMAKRMYHVSTHYFV